MGPVLQAIGYVLLVGGAVVETILASTILTALATGALLSTLSSKLFGPKAPKGILTGIQVMTRSALEHRKVVYGQAMVSGPIYYNNTSGTNNEYLWYGIALCDGQSEDLVSVWFDGNEIPKADIDWTAGTGASDGTGTGDVSTAAWVGDNSTNAVQIYYYLGDDAQPVSGDLNTAFADIGTNHRLRGITHIICQLLYDVDTEKVWESGVPRNIRVVLKGRKLYDPRLDTTQIINTTTSPYTYGSSTHRTTDSSTWVWSENPALCVADYLLNIMGVGATSINWESIANAADDCEVSVITSTTSPETTETRFTCNGALSLGSTHKDNLDSIISAMNGRLSYSGGTWKLRAGVWEASSVAIDADDLAGPVEVRGSSPKSERFNGVRGFFVDPARNYEAVEFPHVTESTYVTRDNGKTILYDLRLPMTNTPTMAQRIAYRNLAQGNNQVICKIKMNARGSKIAIGDVVSLTLDELSWASKTFRCIEWNRNPDGTFNVTLREDESTDYDDPAGSAYGIAGTGGVTVPAAIVPPPTALTATAVGTGIQLAWTNPAASLFDYIDIYQSDSSAWGGASKIASVRADTYLVSLFAGEVRYFWVRAVRLPSLESLRSPDSDTSSITATAPTAGGAGAASVFVNQYIRSSGTPSTPGTTSASYNFDDTPPTFTPTSSWSVSVPSQTSPVTAVWVSTAQFYTADGTGTDSTTTWSAPQKLAEDGADGSPGTVGSDGSAAVFVNQFIRNASAPSTPGTTSASYNFDTTTFTPTSSWAAGVPAAGSPTLPIWVSTAQFYSADGTGTDSSTTWTAPQKLAEDGTPGLDGSDGTDGIPGLPGANTICIFDDADSVLSSTTASKYGFGTSASPIAGTFNWAQITNGTVTYLTVPNLSKGSTEDYTNLHAAVVSGDVVTWYDDEAYPGRWVSYKTTGVGVAITGGYRFPVSVINSFDNGNTDVVPFATGWDVQVRWSRADPGTTGLTFGDVAGFTKSDTGIGTGNPWSISLKVDNDGDLYSAIEGGGYGSNGTWIGNGLNTDYDVMCSVGQGDDAGSGTLNTWQVCSTDRIYSWSQASTGTLLQATATIRWRNSTTNVEMGSIQVNVLVGDLA